jgi:integrase
MNWNLRAKHGEYYAVATWRSPDNKRKERWVPLKILEKEDRKREAHSLLDRLSEPGAFDINDLEKTNRTLESLGLYKFDSSWRVERAGLEPRASVGHPIVYEPTKDMTASQVSEGQMALKKGKRMLFGDYLAIWFNIHKEGIAMSSVASLKGQVFHIIAPWFNKEKITLLGIQPEDIEAFYRERAEAGAGANTLRHYHGTIRCALQYAFKRGYVVNNIADRVEKPKKGDFKGSFFDEEELSKLLKAVKGSNVEFAIYMAAYYGLRREEICGLKWDAIDFQYKTMTIKHTLVECVIDGEQKLYFRDSTKTKSSFRTLPISDETMNKLIDMKERQEKMKTLFGGRYNHDYDDYIYVFENGDIVRPNWVTYNFRKALVENGMRKIRFHDLRHSCATLLRHEGVPMENIQKWLGHSNIQTTEGIYAHYDDSESLDTLKVISGALDDKKPGSEMK